MTNLHVQMTGGALAATPSVRERETELRRGAVHEAFGVKDLENPFG